MKLTRWLLMLVAWAALMPATALAQAQATIAGRVVDQRTMEPLGDVQVVVVGTTRGALTGPDGRYRIEGVTPGTHSVRATRIGYDGQTVAVTVGAGATGVANFELNTAAVSLDAVVVTATGEQRRRELANAVSNVDADRIVETAPITDVSDLLQGRAAGVSVLSAAGTTGTGARIRIRGSNSISLSNDPVVFIDGIRVDSDSDFSVDVGGQTTSALGNLNAEEIESIEVIKGPSAATLYGTDAANGVIRITTKRGVEGTPRWSTWIEQGVLDDYIDYPENYAALDAEGSYCLLLDVADGLCEQADLRAFSPLETERTSPFRTGYRRQYGLSVSGGGEGITYFLSGEFEGEDGVLGLSDAIREDVLSGGGEITESMENPNRLEKVHLRANVGANPLENLSLSISTGYIESDVRLPQADNNIFALVGNALLGSAFEEDEQPYIPFGPAEVFAIDTQQEVSRFIGSANATWEPLDWLTGRATIGVDVSNRFDDQLFPVGAVEYGTLVTGARSSNRVQERNYTLDVGGTATFALTPSLSSRTSVGVQYFRDFYQGTFAYGETLVPGVNSLIGAATTEAFESTAESLTLGTFVEQQFGWNDRLFVTGALRADDNSAFGQEFDLIVYPKLGVSYVAVDDQDEPLFSALNSLRLRAAYGASGLAPGTTDALRFFNPVTARFQGENRGGVSFTDLGAGLAGLGNLGLEPERSSEVELGADVGLLDGRLGLEMTYYNKKTEDALVSRRIAPSLGTTLNRFQNLGSVRNSGFEAAINATLLNRSNASWDLTLTGSVNENELLELGEGVEPVIFGTQRFQEGYPLGGFFDQPLAYDDANDDGILTPDEITVGAEDEYLGSPFPERELSINSSLTVFEFLQISGLLDYRGGYRLLNETEYFRCIYFICEGLFDPDASLANQARALNAIGAAGAETYAPFIEDASFWKLRELGLTFLIPQDWTSRFGTERVSLALTGRNLGTWTDYTGLDPELNYAGAGSNFTQSEFLTQAPVRTFTVRLNVSF